MNILEGRRKRFYDGGGEAEKKFWSPWSGGDKK